MANWFPAGEKLEIAERSSAIKWDHSNSKERPILLKLINTFLIFIWTMDKEREEMMKTALTEA